LDFNFERAHRAALRMRRLLLLELVLLLMATPADAGWFGNKLDRAEPR
jgi:hypothetical protein